MQIDPKTTGINKFYADPKNDPNKRGAPEPVPGSEADRAAAGEIESAEHEGTDAAGQHLYGGRPLSDYDGLSDEQITEMDGVGEATLTKIRKAQKKAERKAAK